MTGSDAITLPELEQYLAKAADLLRGSIDEADFKAWPAPSPTPPRRPPTFS